MGRTEPGRTFHEPSRRRRLRSCGGATRLPRTLRPPRRLRPRPLPWGTGSSTWGSAPPGTACPAWWPQRPEYTSWEEEREVGEVLAVVAAVGLAVSQLVRRRCRTVSRSNQERDSRSQHARSLRATLARKNSQAHAHRHAHHTSAHNTRSYHTAAPAELRWRRRRARPFRPPPCCPCLRPRPSRPRRTPCRCCRA